MTLGKISFVFPCAFPNTEGASSNMRTNDTVPIGGYTLRGVDDWFSFWQSASGAWFYLVSECAHEWRDIGNGGLGDETDADCARVARLMRRNGATLRSVRDLLDKDDAPDVLTREEATMLADLEKNFGKRARAPRDDTFIAVRKRVREMGLTVTKRDGEFRVNYPNGGEATAYYTNDAADAVGTADAMRAFKEKRL